MIKCLPQQQTSHGTKPTLLRRMEAGSGRMASAPREADTTAQHQYRAKDDPSKKEMRQNPDTKITTQHTSHYCCCTLHSATLLPKFSTSIGVTLIKESPPRPPERITHHGSPLAMNDPVSGRLCHQAIELIQQQERAIGAGSTN